MDIKFTFEDGSEALAHYGTKGMKWGVWNAETRERYTDSPAKNTSFQTDMDQRAHVNDDGYITYRSQETAADRIRRQQESARYAKAAEERRAREANYSNSAPSPSKRLSDLSWREQADLMARTEPKKKPVTSPFEAQMQIAMQMHMSDTSSAQLTGGNAILSELLKDW